VALACVLALPAQAVPSLRSELYSVGSTDRFCSRAQQIVANTPLVSWNVVHNDYFAFANASSAPYAGPNTGAFNGTLASYPTGAAYPANQIPLITQQLVSQRELGQTQWEYPIVISCKLKDSESINYHFGPGSAGAQASCREVNQDTVADVYASLTAIEQRTLRWQQSDIVYPADGLAASGPNWLYPLPYLPRVAFIGVDGRLRLRGYAIAVPRTNTDGNVGYDKKGVYYCHLASPEYVRALITGQTNPIIEEVPEF
jgi:hypothetical protein